MTRHHALCLALACALPVTASATPVDATMVTAPRFDPPLDQAMVLTRTVIRALPDGKRIIATRRYRVRFTREDAGYRIDGTLTASEIDVPKKLRELGELERTRPDDGLFPIHLDGTGRITGGTQAGAGDRFAIDAALALTRQMLAEHPTGAGAEQDAAFLARIHATMAEPVSAHWPATLFAPAPALERDERTFALPNHGTGRFSSELRRSAAKDGTTMREAERRITTTVAGDESVAIERWTLAPEA